MNNSTQPKPLQLYTADYPTKPRYRIRVIPLHYDSLYKQTVKEWRYLDYRVRYFFYNKTFQFITKIN